MWVLKDVSNLYGFIIFESKSPFHIHILSIATYSLYRKKKLASYLINEPKKKILRVKNYSFCSDF